MEDENHLSQTEGVSLLDLEMDLPPKPQEPLPSDCCGSGCTPCVFDIYEKDLEFWRKECKEIDTKSKIPAQAENQAALSSIRYTHLELISITKVTNDTSVYRFKLPDGTSLGLNIGQHLLLRSTLEDKVVVRSYTPISSQIGYFDVIIKVYMNGHMSKCIAKWSVGDLMEWRGPFGKFRYKANQHKRIIMLAAGTGIAPMFQIIKGILNNDDDETFLQLMYSCKRSSDILMKNQLDEFTAFWNFKVVYFLTQASEERGESCLKYGDVVYDRRIDREMLSMELPERLDDSQILICGTKSFDKDMINFIFSLGYKEDNIFVF